MTIQVQIVEIDTGEVIHTVDVAGVASVDDRKVQRVEAGMMRQTNLDRYVIRTIDTEESNGYGLAE